MQTLQRCSACESFIPASHAACPNCGEATTRTTSRAKRLVRAAVSTTLGGAVAMTLMACYGPPPRPEANDAARAAATSGPEKQPIPPAPGTVAPASTPLK